MNNTTLKIALIGSTGKIGSVLLDELVNRGYEVNILVRNPEKINISSNRVSIIKGDARNQEAINELVNGCQALINSIGQPRNEAPLFSHVARNILKSGVKRYIVMAGLGMTTPSDKKRLYTRLITNLMHFLFPKIMTDKKVEYSLITQSDLNWTIVRIPRFKIISNPLGIKANENDCPSMSIGSEDLINFLIDQINDNRFFRKAPFVSN